MSLFSSGGVWQPRLFFAKYDGECASCDSVIYAGERIGYDENNKICCEECLSGDSPQPLPEPTRTKRQKVCPECHLAHAGACF